MLSSWPDLRASNRVLTLMIVAKGCPYGRSPRAISHTCVYRKGELVWDPHPSRSGMVKVDTVALIVPVDPSRAFDSQ